MMKRLALVLTLLLVFCSSAAIAASHPSGGLGFHRSVAPIGGRWWFGDAQKVAFDFGFGFDTDEVGDPTTPEPDDEATLFDYAIDIGVPILVKGWDRAHLSFRPGLLRLSDEDFVGGEKDRGSRTLISAELEAEIFIVDNVSFSASSGIAIDMNDPPAPPGDDDSTTEFSSTGNDFTTLGFHVYLGGGD
jgi:hypothetical protein